MGAITDHRNKFDHVEYLDVAIKDNVDVDITQEFGPTIEFIQKAADVGGSASPLCRRRLALVHDLHLSRRFQSLIPTMIIHTDDTNNKYDDDMDVVDDLAHLMQPLEVMARTLHRKHVDFLFTTRMPET
ncbi:hypothetical protein PsorP6_004624 [Peronosclerospora sorghi]|uniref:Uncharacterized protein n=1 Tax=Peronosclerospora sorghi TaxID=230839 RepID=A0ACC0VN73_9STRA|nr:hypothetical protein PsorP6_004624 [Peronosclerospora sorghi]